MKIRMISDVLKEQYGEKIYRLALSSGCTCPNRDGTVGTGGCTFCSEGGSGEFASAPAPVAEQIEKAKALVRGKTAGQHFIAYFQSFTNTYGDMDRLRRLYEETVALEDIAVLALGTRPDCLDDRMIAMLSELNKKKPVWVELGLQTIHAKSAEYIRRGYELPVYEDAVRRLRGKVSHIITHVILGLPGETREDMLESVRYVGSFVENAADGNEFGIKLQLLHVIRGTDLEKDYLAGHFSCMSMEEYVDLIADCIEALPENMVIHRITGDGAKKTLVAPMWSADKKRVLNALNKKLR